MFYKIKYYTVYYALAVFHADQLLWTRLSTGGLAGSDILHSSGVQACDRPWSLAHLALECAEHTSRPEGTRAACRIRNNEGPVGRFGRHPSRALAITRRIFLWTPPPCPLFSLCVPPPTEARARADCLRLPGRDCRHQWPGPLLARLFPGDGAAHRRCSAHGSSVAGVRVRDGRWGLCMTPTGLRAAQELPGSPRAQARQGTVARIHGGRCFLLGVAKKNKIQGSRASSLYSLPLGCPPVPA